MDLVQGVYLLNADADASGFPIPQTDATKGKTIVVFVCDDTAASAKYNAGLKVNPKNKAQLDKNFEAEITRQVREMLNRLLIQQIPTPAPIAPVVFADNVP